MNVHESLVETYRNHGVSFHYPGFWDVTEEQDGDQVTIQVTGPSTSFWSLTLLRNAPLPQRVVESVIEAFRQEYDEMDVYETEEVLCGCPGVSRNIEFVCYEMISNAFVNAFRTADFTALVLAQGADCDLEETRELLDSISRSLQLDE